MNIEELRRATEACDIPSMTALGTVLLIGRDAPFGDGRKQIRAIIPHQGIIARISAILE